MVNAKQKFRMQRTWLIYSEQRYCRKLILKEIFDKINLINFAHYILFIIIIIIIVTIIITIIINIIILLLHSLIYF